MSSEFTPIESAKWENIERQLDRIEQTRTPQLSSAEGQEFDAYRVAYKKAEALHEFCLNNPEILDEVRAEMETLRGLTS